MEGGRSWRRSGAEHEWMSKLKPTGSLWSNEMRRWRVWNLKASQKPRVRRGVRVAMVFCLRNLLMIASLCRTVWMVGERSAVTDLAWSFDVGLGPAAELRCSACWPMTRPLAARGCCQPTATAIWTHALWSLMVAAEWCSSIDDRLWVASAQRHGRQHHDCLASALFPARWVKPAESSQCVADPEIRLV